jgi:hypothetical protein
MHCLVRDLIHAAVFLASFTGRNSWTERIKHAMLKFPSVPIHYVAAQNNTKVAQSSHGAM